MKVSISGGELSFRSILARPDIVADDVAWLMRPLIEESPSSLIDCQLSFSDGAQISVRDECSNHAEMIEELRQRSHGASEMRIGLNPLGDDGSVAFLKWLGIEVVSTVSNPWKMPNMKHQAQVEVVTDDIRLSLAKEGWPQPAVMTAGGRIGLLFRVDLDRNDVDLVYDALRSMRHRHDTENAKIGSFGPENYKVFVPGAMIQRGKYTIARPHQMAGILRLVDDLDIVPKHKIERLATSN